MTLIATGRSSATSRPSSTCPMPPAPSSRSTSYRPVRASRKLTSSGEIDGFVTRIWSRRRHAAGADVVKFQSFRADKLATAEAAKASYQQVTTGTQQSQLEMLRALELGEDDEQRIAAACAKANITYMSTPFDADSATHLVERIGVSTLKVGSGDLTNAPLLLHLARFRLPIILSTGMATLAEVEQALGVIAFGYLREASAQPTATDFSPTSCLIAKPGRNCAAR